MNALLQKLRDKILETIVTVMGAITVMQVFLPAAFDFFFNILMIGVAIVGIKVARRR